MQWVTICERRGWDKTEQVYTGIPWRIYREVVVVLGRSALSGRGGGSVHPLAQNLRGSLVRLLSERGKVTRGELKKIVAIVTRRIRETLGKGPGGTFWALVALRSLPTDESFRFLWRGAQVENLLSMEVVVG